MSGDLEDQSVAEHWLAAQRPDGVDALGLAATDPNAVSAMGRAQLLNQGFAGFVLQLFQGWGIDANGEAIGLGFQVAGTFGHDVE
jgi:hypothetical protein